MGLRIWALCQDWGFYENGDYITDFCVVLVSPPYWKTYFGAEFYEILLFPEISLRHLLISIVVIYMGGKCGGPDICRSILLFDHCTEWNLPYLD